MKGHIQNKLKEEEITEIANKVVQKYLNDFENMKIVYCEDGVKQSVNEKCENECPTGSINSFISVSSNSLCGNNVPNCYENNNVIWYNKVCDEPHIGGLYFDFSKEKWHKPLMHIAHSEENWSLKNQYYAISQKHIWLWTM